MLWIKHCAMSTESWYLYCTDIYKNGLICYISCKIYGSNFQNILQYISLVIKVYVTLVEYCSIERAIELIIWYRIHVNNNPSVMALVHLYYIYGTIICNISHWKFSLKWYLWYWLNNWQCNRSLFDIDGLVQQKRDCIANALELCLSCTNPSISYAWVSVNIVTWCQLLHVMCMARLLIKRFICILCVCTFPSLKQNIYTVHIWLSYTTGLEYQWWWIKSISNELDITIHVIESQLSGHCDVISIRLWRHQQN